ncbi:proline-rich transmembrane protein 1-like [Mizuhopecten yessoensis]|uniref:Proline-rich transmembrane protein 1 n=1 Tax=Mizuhopecten yessoensis TaxID=6573 RepID=A0A210Q8I3_MIZYE|nr:proline-rich transmembrane protein 1-like [Mizuhopecten yessoensis]OWF45062.1 Proline-rich transmembrane protein 1 [Mizuhopecten yessoensis]
MEGKSGAPPPPYTNQGFVPPPPAGGNQGYGQPPISGNAGYAQPQGYAPPPPGTSSGWAQPQYQMQAPFQQQTMQTNNVIITQQPGIQHVVMTVPPEDNMVRAIIATFFCFWPIGMFAIWKAMESKSAYNRGDVAMAHAHANSSRQLANFAIGFGTCSIIAAFIYVVVLYSVIL